MNKYNRFDHPLLRIPHPTPYETCTLTTQVWILVHEYMNNSMNFFQFNIREALKNSLDI
jgi:hypothetical protein